ncbi:MAG: hypothetical protein IKK83_01830 [Clostridia bacterium]|nr:hypothetical protein [Clostridia bacterium]
MQAKRFIKELKRAAVHILKAERLGRQEPLGGVPGFVADNAYYYRRKIAEAEKDYGRLNRLPSRNGVPQAFSALWEHFKKNGFVCTKEDISRALDGYDCSTAETDMLKSLICAAAILETGLVCEAAIKDKSLGIGRLRGAFLMLKKAEITDFSSLHSRLSVAERLLEEREDGYSAMTDATRALYRRALRRYSHRQRLAETDAVLAAEKEAARRGCCIGTVLGVERRMSSLFYLLTVGLVFALSAGVAWRLCGGWLTLLLILPLGAFALGLGDFLFSFFGRAEPCPAIDPRKLPRGDLTLTVITTLLGDDDKVFEQLEGLYHTNKNDGFYFGVLADLPPCKTEKSEDDESLIKGAVGRLESLKGRFGDRFCLFIRPRVENRDGTFSGRERKRGAIEDLVRHLRGARSPFALALGADCRGVKYLLTLDGDTRLPPEGAAVLTGMMLHPLNRPKLRGGRVCSGYGIIQPAVKPCLSTEKKSRFSELLTGAGGIEVYESAAFDRHQSVFGEGIFCGKGIIDIALYSALLDGALPAERVLSHDMPEGNILRTRYVADLCFTDSVPTGVAGYFSRLHRWIRGDVQNLSLIFGYGQGFRGGGRIVMNVLRHLCPVFSLLTLVFAGFFVHGGKGLWACFFALINMLSPLLYTFISRPAALKFRARRFFSSVEDGAVQSLRTVFFEFSTLCYKGLLTIDAFTKAVYRLIRRKRLLSWVTAAQTEKKEASELGGYILRFLPSALVGTVCFFLSSLWVTRLLGLIWFMAPLYAFAISVRRKEKAYISQRERRLLFKRALPIWKFFEENVGAATDWLPPDNIQLSPVEAVAMRTSPTNIGLYLLSVVAAEDFGLITGDETEKRLENAVGSIERLEKWKGHLYNWYSLSPTAPIGGGYVSTVDSGNFCVCLLALSRFLYSSGRAALGERVERLYRGADFSALYNGERNLFALGADGKTGALSDICYDLFMSEARSTSYFAVATGQVPLKHWRTLGRPLIGNARHIGMASWSGTAFEFLMPQLFLPLYKNSFIYESLVFALSQQMRHSSGRLWGCSESAYYCFDSEMNYQYKAHGVQSLALCRYKSRENILSPYSVYLSLCLAPKAAIAALGAYEEAGMAGRYGLYEAIDFTVKEKGGAVIQSYMAHHMGMSLIALANACFDGVFVKRFMNHPATGAFYELLQEKIPVGAPIHATKKSAPEKKREPLRIPSGGKSTVLSSGETVFYIGGKPPASISADSLGHIRFSYGNITVNETHFDRHSTARSFSVAFINGKDAYYATPERGGEGYSFEGADGYAAHICSTTEFSGRVKYFTDGAGCFVVESKSDGRKSYSMCFSFDVQLCEDREFYAHPAFNRLFISAEYDKSLNALIYTKNSRDGRSSLFLAVGLADDKVGFGFETRKESYGAFSQYSARELLKDCHSGSTGVCVTPFCQIKTAPLAGGECRLILALGHTRKECAERLVLSRRISGKGVGTAICGGRENRLLEGILLGRRSFAETEYAKEGALWAHGVSGDYPIIAVLVREFFEKDARFFIGFFKRIATLGTRMELVFLVCEEDSYRSDIRSSITRIAADMKCEGFIGKRGGIMFADGRDVKTVKLFMDAAVCFTESYDTPFGEGDSACHVVPLPPVIRRHSPSPGLSGRAVGGGVYEVDSFTADKDEELALPFSYVLAGRGFGSVVTQSTLGYSFYGNAALGRISASCCDPYGGTDRGEVLYLMEGGRVYDAVACASTARYENGVATYRGEAGGRAYTVTVFVCHKLPVKSVEIRFEDGKEGEVALSVAPLMGSGVFPCKSVKMERMDFCGGVGKCFTNPASSFFEGKYAFVACLGKGELYSSESELLGAVSDAEDVAAVKMRGSTVVFLIGAAQGKKGCENVAALFARRGTEKEKASAVGFAKSMLPPLITRTFPALDAMLCTFAPYDTAACRFFARAAFYQSGGAYGFRDQLQDCMYLVYAMPKTVRCHLLRAAARQYTEGCVQHWWHPCKREGRIYGIRSRCSDDFLWLPIAVWDYVEKTGDRSVLEVELPYLHSAPLGDERERYEAAEVTAKKESLLEHCRRAIDYGRHYGVHGLPLMGSCDWNDAFSALPEEAESVFCAFLRVIALRCFAALSGEEEYGKEAAELLDRAEKAFVGDRFVRAYIGTGTPLGVDGRGACEIDILSQAFAVFAGANREKCRIALRTAYERLYDSSHRVLRLFSPPFGKDTEYAGYINAYAKGVRENGGQYTHAALWFCAALAMCGLNKEASELIFALNPLVRGENSELFAGYKVEPYCLAADIYMAKGQKGRGGWTHYTGASGWFCKTVLEVFMGIELRDGFSALTVRPLMEYEMTLSFKGTLRIRAVRGGRLSYDGRAVSFPLMLEEGEHELTVPLWSE